MKEYMREDVVYDAKPEWLACKLTQKQENLLNSEIETLFSEIKSLENKPTWLPTFLKPVFKKITAYLNKEKICALSEKVNHIKSKLDAAKGDRYQTWQFFLDEYTSVTQTHDTDSLEENITMLLNQREYKMQRFVEAWGKSSLSLEQKDVLRSMAKERISQMVKKHSI